MTDLTTREIYENLVSNTAPPPTPSISYQDLVAKTQIKQEELAVASQEKRQALGAFEESVDARNSFAGQLTGLGVDSDLAREVVQNALSGTGYVAKGFGELGQALNIGEGETGDRINNYLQGLAQNVDQQQTVGFRNEMARSTPTGDILDPSTWSFGDDPSVTGYLGQVAALAGQFTPQALSLLLSNGFAGIASTAAVGGLQAGGGAVAEVEQTLGNLSEQQLSQTSGLYRDLRAQSVSHENAKQQVIDAASQASLLGAGTVGAIGGAATAYILGPLTKKLGTSLSGKAFRGSVVSGLEEGTQEVGEVVAARAATNEAINSNTDLTEGTFGDFVLGAGFGSALGTIPAAKDIAAAVVAPNESEAEIIKSTPEVEQEVEKAKETGDITSLIIPDSPTYNPIKGAQALYERIKDPEQEAPVREAATQNLQALVSFIQEDLDIAQRNLTQVQESGDSSAIEVAQQQVNELEKQNEAVQLLNEKVLVDEIQATDIEEVVKDVEANTEGAADNLVKLYMADPELVSTEQINGLLSNTDIRFTDTQRSTLRRISEAQFAQNRAKGLEGVQRDVFEGSEGFKGLDEYQTKFNAAIRRSNKPLAQSEVDGLESFALRHENKLATVTQALNNAQDNNQTYQVVYDENTGWGISPTRLSQEALDSNNGLTIHKGSSGLVENIQKEATALRTNVEAMKNTVANWFPAIERQAPVATAQPSPTQTTNDTPVAESTSETLTEAPTQSVREQKLEEREKPDQELDVIKAFYTQRKGKKSDKSEQALVTIPDLVSKVEAGDVNLERFTTLPIDTETKVTHLQKFFSKAKEWSESYPLNIKAKPEQFKYKNPIQFYMEDGQLPENVQTALSFAAFKYIAENGPNSRYNDKKTVNRILRRDEDAPILKAEEILYTAGTQEKLLISDLGKAATQALGLKPDRDAPDNVQSLVEGSFGNHVLALMLRAGLVERVAIPGELFENENTKNKKAPHIFIRVRDTAEIADINQSATGTGSVLSNIFNVESGYKLPSLTPVTSVPKKAKDTRQNVSKEQTAILKKVSKQAHYLEAPMVSLFNSFDRADLEEMAGIEQFNPDTMHSAREGSLGGKNLGLTKELDHMQDFIQSLTEEGSDLNQPIYFGRSVWQMFRVGLDSNTINPQTSKIHRHMISMGGWESTVEFNNADGSLENFYLAVGEALGVSTDKQVNDVSFKEIKKLLNNSEITAGVDAIVNLLTSNNISEPEKLAIKQAVSIGGKNFHSLQGLTALAQMKIAEQNNEDGFTTTLAREVDGVTNGPMFTLFQLAAMPTDESLIAELNKGGFYEEGNLNKHYSEWASQAGNEDLYKSIASDVNSKLRNVYRNNPQLQKPIEAGFYFLGNFVKRNENQEDVVTSEGRKALKTPITGFAFGSSIDTAVSNMAADVIEAYYTKLEEAVGNADQQALDQTVTQINAYLPKHMQVAPMTLDTALKQSLTKEQSNQIIKVFSETTGYGVKEVFNANFSGLIESRNKLNQANKLSFEMYDAVYKALREQKIAEKPDGGKFTLTANEDAEIREQIKSLEPVIHTPFSKKDNNLSAGIYLAKTERFISPDSAYVAESDFTAPLPSNLGSTGNTKSLKSRGVLTRETDPGVSGVIKGIHSVDSTVSSRAYNKSTALNIHDAHMLSLKETVSGAKELNKQTFNVMLEYSLPVETSNALIRTLTGYREFVQNNPELREPIEKAYRKTVSDLRKRFGKQLPELNNTNVDPIVAFSRALKADALSLRERQLSVLGKLATVDQYALEGGSYAVTADDKAKVQQELEKVRAAKSGQAIATAEPEISETSPSEKVLGTNEQQRVNLEAMQTALLASTTAADMLRNTRSMMPDALKPIADLLAKHPMLQNVRVQQAAEGETYNGAFTPQGSGGVIEYNFTQLAKSPYRRFASYAPALVIHEMMHAVTHGAINRKAGYNKDQRPYYKKSISDQATALHNTVQQWVVNNTESLSERQQKLMSEALSNVDELLAYGTTDMEVQEVLKQIPSVTNKRSAFAELVNLFLKAIGLGSKHDSVLRDVFNLAARAQAYTARVQANVSGQKLLQQDPTTNTQQLTTEQVFDALTPSGSDPVANSHLKSVIESIVDKLYGPYGAFAIDAWNQAAYTSEEVYLKSLVTNQLPFASEAIAELKLEHHEALVLEQTELSIKAAADSSHIIYNELNSLYRQAKSQLENDPALTKDEYDFIFRPTANGNNRSAYLARFAALGLVYPPLNKKLQTMRTGKVAKRYRDMQFGEALQTFLARILDFLNGRLTKTFNGQFADSKLTTLVSQLVDKEAQKKASIMQEVNHKPNKLSEAIQHASDKARAVVESLGKSPIAQSIPTNTGKAIGNIASMIAGERTEQFFDDLERVRNRLVNERQGILAGILSEVRGANDGNKAFHQLLRYANKNEQERKRLIDETASLVRESFNNLGRQLTTEQRSALTRVFVRGDLASLLDSFSMSDIANLTLDPNELAKQISTLESELTGKNKHYYIKSAKDLGYHLATGKAVGENLMLNAHNIGYMANTTRMVVGKDARIEKMIPLIDQLASLYALQYMPRSEMELAREVLRTEMNRGPENGVELILRIHKGLQKQALESTFDNNPVHFMKGYVKEIYDPRISIVAATVAEGKKLMQMGYSRQGKPLPQDPADPSPIKHLYVIKDGGLNPHLTGSLSYTGQRTKGSTLHQGLTDVLSDSPNLYNARQNQTIARKKSKAIEAMFLPNPRYSPEKAAQSNRLVPVLNHNGDVVNYRYLMNDQTRDTLLNRNNEVDTVLGSIAGSTFDKAITPSQNKAVIQALYDQYQEEFADNPESYITVSPDSSDPEIAENYKLLPDATKKAIKEIWGKNSMQVRVDLYDINFGYRKYSLANMFSKDAEHQKVMEKVFVNLMEGMFGEKAALRISQAEDVWQEVVRMTKDILVIKNLFTLVGNISSNVTMLLWMGVPATKIIGSHTTAIKGMLAYQRDRKELSRIQQLVDIGYVTGNEADRLRDRMVELEDSIDRNPVKELIDVGLFQTIVEDVDNEDDRFSYSSRLSEFVERKTEWVPDTVKTATRTLLMTHDTPLYKVLNQATSMSDFIARYTLHEHMTTRKKNPMSKDDSIQLASDAFVNYDVPSHRTLQYLNDMGIVWFTKYYLRIQKVILHLYREHPGRSLALISLEHFFPFLDTIMDAGFWNKIGNPFSLGALNAPGAVDEILPIKMALSPFN